MKMLLALLMVLLAPLGALAAVPTYPDALDDALSLRIVHEAAVEGRMKWGRDYGMTIQLFTSKDGGLGMLIWNGESSGHPSETADTVCAIEWDRSGRRVFSKCVDAQAVAD